MKREEFREYLQDKIMILDGAMGTLLQKRGMPLGVCPELWSAEHPERVTGILREYIEAGSQVVYTPTLGGNRRKLAEFGLENKVVELNRRLAEITRLAVGESGLVAGDISLTGDYIEPFGEVPFAEAVEVYKEQVKGLLEGGVDLFVIETMMDIQEARAALLAVKESCDLPVWVSMTFNEDGRTIMGTDPVTAVITLQNLGADAVGCNCSTGPEAMIDIIRKMKTHAVVPLIAKPNAGLPILAAGETVFDMSPVEFGSFIRPLVEAGANLIGGCCGTTPEYIKEIKAKIAGLKPVPPKSRQGRVLTSARRTVEIGPQNLRGQNIPAVIVGERINPTGKKALQAELQEGKTTLVRSLALEQAEQGAAVLDVNVGMPGVNEKEIMLKVVADLSTTVDLPLCLDSSDPETLEAALRLYPGRALINSLSLERVKMERLLPVAAKYGAMFILLPVSDAGLPETAEERFKVIEEVYDRAKKYGYHKEDMVVDGLVMTVSTNQRAAVETLKVIAWCTDTFKAATIIGLSNVSFGLPERGWINAAFLAMAVGRGLTMVIANPASEAVMQILKASDLLVGNDPNGRRYIAAVSKEALHRKQFEDIPRSIEEKIYEAVVKGDKERITELVRAAVNEKISPELIVDRYLIPAITHVGDLFAEKIYFLPQLIMSAETMKRAFEYLEPLLGGEEKSPKKNKAKVILATVKGDVHDIGKNIVGLMLKNYGFTVIDLGKDVDAGEIIRRAKKEEADIIGLSALMTTTMAGMKEVIQLAKKEGLKCKFMIGGAVVNRQYAEEIGADGYARDAYEAVKLAESLIDKE